MAIGIDDDETATLAREFAEKHERRHLVLEHKSVALKEELEMRRGEFAEMIEAIKDAEINRETLTATAGRTSARNSIDGHPASSAVLDPRQVFGLVVDRPDSAALTGILWLPNHASKVADLE